MNVPDEIKSVSEIPENHSWTTFKSRSTQSKTPSSIE